MPCHQILLIIYMDLLNIAIKTKWNDFQAVQILPAFLHAAPQNKFPRSALAEMIPSV